MKVEFEFEPPEGEEVAAVEGVAVINCYDEKGRQLVLYGNYGEPSGLAAIGLLTVGLRDAEAQFAEGEETG